MDDGRLFLGGREHDVKGSDLVRLFPHSLLLQIKNERFIDTSISRVSRNASIDAG
jgi:hypothetical protein